MAKLFLFCSRASSIAHPGALGYIRGFEWKLDERAITAEYTDFAIGCPACFTILRLRLYPGFNKGAKEKAELVIIKRFDVTGESDSKGWVPGDSWYWCPHTLYLKRSLLIKWLSEDIELCKVASQWATPKERKQVLKKLGILGKILPVGFVVPL